MEKSAHYRRCEWIEDESLVLMEVLSDTYDQIVGTGGFADYSVGSGWRCIVKQSPAGTGQRFFHFVIYEQGSHAAVVSVVNTDIDEIEPPDDTEFIESQLFVLVRGNHVLYTTHNKPMRDGSVTGALVNFVGQEFDEPQTQFHLVPTFNEDQLRRVYDEGIDHIDLGLGSFAQTVESLKRGGKIPKGSIFEGLREFFGAHNDADDDRAAAQLKARLALLPGRSWDKQHVKDYLTGLAMAVTSDFDNEFVIVTKGGVRVTHHKITVKEAMEVGGNNRILDVDDVRSGLRSAMQRLRAGGILEQ